MKLSGTFSFICGLLIATGLLYSGFSIRTDDTPLCYPASANEELVENAKEDASFRDNVDLSFLYTGSECGLKHLFEVASVHYFWTVNSPPANPDGWVMPFRI